MASLGGKKQQQNKISLKLNVPIKSKQQDIHCGDIWSAPKHQHKKNMTPAKQKPQISTLK